MLHWRWFVNTRKEDDLIESYRQALQIKMVNSEQEVRKLSGGNQQKVILARCMALNPRVLIVDEPTRGIDVGTKSEVHQVLFDMAKNGSAPKAFSKLDRRGVPMNALYATTAIAALCFLTTFIGEQAVFNWLLNMSGMCGFIVWLGIAISHYRFRKGYVHQGYKLEDLAYRAKFFPFAPWFAFILCAIVVLGQNYQAVLDGDILAVISTYIGIFLFLAIWLGYKWKYKAKMVSYQDMDVRPMNVDKDA